MEAVRDCIEQIEQIEPRVGAFLTVLGEAALAEAKRSEERWRAGEQRLLEGVPYGLKDVIATAGVRTTGGSRLYQDWVPDGSATVARRLEAAGGLLLGKLQTFELAGAVPVGPLGAARNPWDLERTTGGSSSGSGAALAARELPLAIGTDTGGSIRIPAALCGVCGIKPTYGLVSRQGVMTRSWTLDHVGPMARSVADLALALAAIAGHDPLDPTSSQRPSGTFAHEDGVRGMRIGVLAEWTFPRSDPGVVARTREALAVLEEAGASLVEVRLQSVEEHGLDNVAKIISGAESAAAHEENRDRIDQLSDLAAQRLLANLSIPAVDYLRAMRLRNLVQQDLEAVFADVDALAGPTTPATAPLLADGLARVGERTVNWLEVAGSLTTLANVTGVPALSIPAGFSSDGLPVGFQVIARPFADSTCFRVGAALQALTDHHHEAPPLIATKGVPLS